MNAIGLDGCEIWDDEQSYALLFSTEDEESEGWMIIWVTQTPCDDSNDQ